MERFPRIATLTVFVTLVLGGCDMATAPSSHSRDADPSYQPSTVVGDDTSDAPHIGVFTVCKSAPDDTTQAFIFDVAAEGPNTDLATLHPSVELSDGVCKDVYAIDDQQTGSDAVTVAERTSAGWALEGVTVHRLDEAGTVTTHEAAGPEVTESITPGTRGVLVTYRNVPSSSADDDDAFAGEEGCTPGAWKNRLLALGRWPVAENTPVSDVWNVPPGLEDATLLDALRFGGGPTFEDKVQILLRAATAAYLNARTLEYSLTAQQVIDDVNTAIASGDSETVIALAEELDRFNNQDCPITERDYEG